MLQAYNIIDSHSHLHLNAFSEDRAQVIARAKEKGIGNMLLVGLDPDDSLNALKVAKGHQGIFSSIGIHPHGAGEYTPDDVFKLGECATDEHIIAVGETGIDLYRAPDTLELQRDMFRAHIELARSLGLPIIIHDRKAHDIVLKVLDEERGWDLGGVIHCFSGGLDMAKYATKKGFFISVPGVITFEGASKLRDIISKVPLEFLLVETDAPFLAPVPYRGKRNEPCFMIETVKALAEIKGVSFYEMAAITTSNFSKLFLKRRTL